MIIRFPVVSVKKDTMRLLNSDDHSYLNEKHVKGIVEICHYSATRSLLIDCQNPLLQ